LHLVSNELYTKLFVYNELPICYIQSKIDCQYKQFQGIARHRQQGGTEEPGELVVPADTLQPGCQEILQGTAT
jgi:hypothetical protein